MLNAITTVERKTHRAHGTGPRAAADQVLRCFNTWAYKREQPSDPDLLRETIAGALADQAPVPFVLYWGKGPRRTIAAPEQQCLDFLASLGDRIKSVYNNGATFSILLTDTHARLNQHTEPDIDAYYTAIEEAANLRGFVCRRLSDVSNAACSRLTSAPTESADADMFRRLTESAAKWYCGDTPATGAAQYFQMNMREKRAVDDQYPDAIFVTFNSSRYRVLFPDTLPIFYMYSLKKGVAVKPWFMDAEPTLGDVCVTVESGPLSEGGFRSSSPHVLLDHATNNADRRA